MSLTILFPCQYDDVTSIDFVFEHEYNVAKTIPGLKVALFSFMIWDQTGEIRFNIQPEPSTVIIRGYMMFPEQYSRFYSKLHELGLELITTPDQYSLFHLFPNIYPEFEAHTPKTLSFPDGTPIDYVKSVKETKFPKKFDTPIVRLYRGICV